MPKWCVTATSSRAASPTICRRSCRRFSRPSRKRNRQWPPPANRLLTRNSRWRQWRVKIYGLFWRAQSMWLRRERRFRHHGRHAGRVVFGLAGNEGQVRCGRTISYRETPNLACRLICALRSRYLMCCHGSSRRRHYINVWKCMSYLQRFARKEAERPQATMGSERRSSHNPAKQNGAIHAVAFFRPDEGRQICLRRLVFAESRP